MSGRLTPPDNQQGEFGYRADDAGDARSGATLDMETARKLGIETYEASTDWLNSGRREEWDNNLRAFQGRHASDSKYNSSDYRYRSRFYRPKSRSMVRRDEAATAAAFFSNEDVVSISASDDSDPRQQASADVLKALLQYRLTKTIPWFQTVLGARQDCDVMGGCVLKAYWKYEERFIETRTRPRIGVDGVPVIDPATGEPFLDDYDLLEKLKDHPWVDLIAPENFRFEPGCDWRDPVHSSPYLIELEPVYIQEARERMEGRHGSEPEWLHVDDNALRRAGDPDDEGTRRSREGGGIPGRDSNSWKPRDFDLCWTRVYSMRWGGRDWHYRTLAGTGQILTEPRPLDEVHLHGERPYVIGNVILEAHKAYPSSKIELTRDLQSAANEDWNMRFDCVRLNLMPRQFVRNGSGIDPVDVRTFMPGKVVLLNGKPGEPLQNEVTWDRPPPPDASAYAEQDRINLDFDELTGAFTNSSVQASQINQQSATGMHLMSGEAGTIAEYELRMFAETTIEPLIRLLIKLEQAYETDPIILALAGKRAELFTKFGVDAITDELLSQDVTVRANVGIGASNPALKLRNFVTAGEILGKVFGPAAAMGANFEEVSKEVFALAGYKDGQRFFTPGFDPRVPILQEQLKEAEKKSGPQPDQTRVEAAKIQADSNQKERQIEADSAREVAGMDIAKTRMEEDGDNWRAWLAMQRELMTHPAFVGGQPPDVPPPTPGATPPVPEMAGMMPPPVPQPPQGAPAMPLAPVENEMKREEFVDAVGQIVVGIEEGNHSIAQAIGQIAQAMMESSAKNEDRMAEIMARLSGSHEAMAAAMSKKKRVVRGADGRVEGVEAV